MLLKLSKLDVVIGCAIAVGVSLSTGVILNVLGQLLTQYYTH